MLKLSHLGTRLQQINVILQSTELIFCSLLLVPISYSFEKPFALNVCCLKLWDQLFRGTFHQNNTQAGGSVLPNNMHALLCFAK